MTQEDPKSITLPVLRVVQPIGEYFVGVLDSKTLCEITDFDVRRILKEGGERDFETYLGIQRPLNPKRVKEIAQYVKTLDACFPTSVILSVSGVCARYQEPDGELTLSNYQDPESPENSVLYRQIAKVLDGQHRIEGLKEFVGTFDISVCIFIDIDVAEEGYIFSTVNLAQTKVNKSLVYDLFDLARSRSPQKLCHNIAVALDQNAKSPFHHRIKRLGVATEGRFNEMLTQATFVESLMRYISKNPAQDRDLYMRGKTPHKASADESQSLIFRNMMIDAKEIEIADVVWNYFDAVRRRWPVAWDATGKGLMLNKSNGFRGLMRFLKPAYLQLTGPGGVPKAEDFEAKIFKKIDLKDDEFTTDNFKPGTSGEVNLFRTLKEKLGI
jgi:DGQHR domain-containing protein